MIDKNAPWYEDLKKDAEALVQWFSDEQDLIDSRYPIPQRDNKETLLLAKEVASKIKDLHKKYGITK